VGHFFQKVRGDGADLPPRHSPRLIGIAALGGFSAIAAVAGLTSGLDEALILGSFGATCVLVFGYPDVPFSQPRNVVAGHVLSTLCGLIAVDVLGTSWWVAGIAVGVAIAVMMATRTVHPPAGSNPVIVFLAQPDWDFVFFPTLVGALVVVAVAVVYNNLSREAHYPKYWIGSGL
jgi:CBS-domain-containing membrane protein